MCLYPRLLPNPKYKPNIKNGGIPPKMTDQRVALIPVGCQKCIECRKQKAREWRIRLSEEIKEHKPGTKYFVTLTFSTESLQHIRSKINDKEGYELDNEIATRAIRYFLERWRWEHKTAPRHWLITELGHGKWEHLHIHGIIFTTEPVTDIQKHWQYGHVTIGDGKRNYVDESTIGYISKYMTKIDPKHEEYKPKIFTSKGIGAGYLKDKISIKNNQYKPNQTNETYKTQKGNKLALPIYYRNKIYTEEQREKLWLEKLDKGERWVLGSKTKADSKEYTELVKYARRKNKTFGYGGEPNYKQEEYEAQRRTLLYTKRLDSQNLGTSSTETMGPKRERQARKQLTGLTERLRKISERPKRNYDEELGD